MTEGADEPGDADDGESHGDRGVSDGDPTADPREHDSVSAADAFAVLSDETRVAILDVLGDARTDPERWGLSYSDLREAVGVRDKGRFNYHLGKLVGRFVWKVDDRYVLDNAGMQLYTGFEAGRFTDRVHVEPWPLDADCRVCGTAIRASYRNALILHCPDCEIPLTVAPLSPAALASRSREGALRAADLRLRSWLRGMRRGVCPHCSGRVDHTFRPDMETLRHENEALALYVINRCADCGWTLYSTLGQSLVTHPAVVAFADEHGVDLVERRLWDLDFAMSDARVSVRSRDPWRVEKPLTLAGETLRLTVDGSLSVVERTRD